MHAERTRLSRHAEIAKAIDCMLKRWPALTRFLDDGWICLTNNAAERARCPPKPPLHFGCAIFAECATIPAGTRECRLRAC
jgi:hypothetical protein